MFLFSSVRPGRHELETDDDSRVRLCHVKLYRKPIVAIIGYHWALYFDWQDGHHMHYEATDVDGYLIARCCQGEPDTTAESIVMSLGRKELSPKRVNTCARENRFNGRTYVLTKMNCQIWAKELAKLLNITIPIPTNLLGYIAGSEILDIFHFASKSIKN